MIKRDDDVLMITMMMIMMV